MSAFGAAGYEPLEILDSKGSGDRPAILKQAISDLSAEKVAAAPGGATPAQQFWLYELGDETNPLIDPHLAETKLDGSDREPDALAQIELEAFNFGKKLNYGEKARATLRLDIGKDKQSRSDMDMLLWSAASAIDLFKQSQTKRPADLSFKGNDIFKRRPAEIPGGLAQFRIEVIRHDEPELWRKIFDAFTGKGAQALIQTLGFPGVTLEVVKFIDNMFSQYTQNKAEVLFQSQPMTMALTKRAKTDFVMDNVRVLAASLNPSRYVIVGQKDLDTLREARPLYLSGPGVLVREKDYAAQRNNYNYDKNDLNDITYGILRVRSRTAQLVQSINV